VTFHNNKEHILPIALLAPVSNLSGARCLTPSFVCSCDFKSQRLRDCRQLRMRSLNGCSLLEPGIDRGIREGEGEICITPRKI